jgi:hypothetical protein
MGRVGEEIEELQAGRDEAIGERLGEVSHQVVTDYRVALTEGVDFGGRKGNDFGFIVGGDGGGRHLFVPQDRGPADDIAGAERQDGNFAAAGDEHFEGHAAAEDEQPKVTRDIRAEEDFACCGPAPTAEHQQELDDILR